MAVGTQRAFADQRIRLCIGSGVRALNLMLCHVISPVWIGGGELVDFVADGIRIKGPAR
jgi:hypothetical protein